MVVECRLCYLGTNAKSSVNIFDKNYDPPIWKMIIGITNLTILETDPYTKIVCGRCFDLLNKIDMFVKTALYTDWKIRQIDKNNHDKQQLSQDVINSWHHFHGYSPPAGIESNDDYKISFDEVLRAVKTDPSEIKNETDDCDNDLQDEQLRTSATINDDGPMCNDGCTSDANDYVLTETKIEIEEDPLQIKNDDADHISNNNNNANFNDSKNNRNVIKYELDKDATSGHNNKADEFIENHQISNNHHNLDDKNIIIDDTNGTNVIVHTGKSPYECATCGKLFSKKSKLQYHLRVHTGERPYECNICEKKFSIKSNLQQHITTVHTKNKSNICNICNKQFSSKNNLRIHLRIHTGDKPYHCDKCDKKFSQLISLQCHLRIHTGDRPYECEICGKRCLQKSDLQRHITVHTGERPYECDVCAKNFLRKDQLQYHVTTVHLK